MKKGRGGHETKEEEGPGSARVTGRAKASNVRRRRAFSKGKDRPGSQGGERTPRGGWERKTAPENRLSCVKTSTCKSSSNKERAQKKGTHGTDRLPRGNGNERKCPSRRGKKRYPQDDLEGPQGKKKQKKRHRTGPQNVSPSKSKRKAIGGALDDRPGDRAGGQRCVGGNGKERKVGRSGTILARPRLKMRCNLTAGHQKADETKKVEGKRRRKHDTSRLPISTGKKRIASANQKERG